MADQSLRCYISSFNGLDNQMFLLLDTKQGGVRLTCNGMSWSGACRDEAILGASDPSESLSPMSYSATLNLISSNPSHEQSRTATFFEGG